MSYRLAPLQLFWAYTVFAFCCLGFGPVGYKDLDIWVLVRFIGPFIVFFSIGFRLGVGPRWPGSSTPAPALQPVDRRILWLLWPLSLWAFGSSLYSWAAPAISGQSVSLTALGESYVEGYRGYVRGTATIDAAYIVTIFDQTIVSLTLLLGLSNFGRLSRWLRWVVVVVLASYVLTNLLFTGKQKYLGDAVIFSGAVLLIALAAQRARIRPRTVLAAVGGLLVTVGLFAEILRQRYIAAGVDIENAIDKVHPLMTWDTGSVLFRVLGPDYGFAAGFFLSYFSNGLYGLYLSLSLPFEWSYFAGSSYSLSRIVEIGLDTPGAILEQTYPYRVGEVYGWGFDKWHSAFAWVASDLSFPGILALSPLAGIWYGRLWKQAVGSTNPFAAPLFAYLSLGLVFIYSNNQMVHSLAGVFVLASLTFGWTVCELTRPPARTSA